MAYIFKFSDADRVVNLVKTNPRVSFFCYNGLSYYNNQYPLSGAFSASILGGPSGYVSLYEQNIDRSGSINFANSDVISPAASNTIRDPFGYAVANATDPTSYYIGANPGAVTWKVKDGTRINFKTVSTKEFNLSEGGNPFYNDYPLTASIQKFYYSAASEKMSASSGAGTNLAPYVSGAISYLYALKNTMNYYAINNPAYEYSSSFRNLSASTPTPGATNVGLVTIPSIFYGDTIKRGSVSLKFYITGALMGELQDTNQNGSLIQVGPPGSPGSGSTAGVILYNEGFVVLTGSWDLSAGSHTEDYVELSTPATPSWINFAQTISSSAPACPQSSFALDFSGSHKIPTLTLFAQADKGDLNHSNNPTYRDKNTQILLTTGSTGYTQNPEALIKNVVSSSYPDPTGSFAKTTYISQIGLYDKNKNLIGIAKLAKPVKKTPGREFTFKIKMDL
jgi:hypothetical protein